ncbi:MAG TPA: aminopeptidase, partial [Bacillota bacterium]|nr:aminopeptidase [Bacillota bacterium]
FIPFDRNAKYKRGDKVYLNNRGKSIFLAVIGEDLNEGANLVMAHTDSPRIDIRQRPLYEAGGMSYFKTHYYGGLKKYQWTAMPLSLHGVIIKNDVSVLKINIGEAEDDPVFYISDLMPHIGKDQFAKNLSNAIEGEDLNVINGSVPLEGDEDESIKLAVLALLNEKYGINEKDFINAELCVVPASKSRDVGFDRGMIAAYGQDDRICAYPAITAIFQLKNPQRTAIAAFADKEEIGSCGVTGLRSGAMRYFFMDMCDCTDAKYTAFCENSVALSADVGGAFDPTFANAYEEKNSSYVSKGVCITKYTGARGKSGSSDASAELFSSVTRLLDGEGIVWQTGEYGKVDQGGAGTVATEIAELNIDVVDFGVPIISMHSPVELASKVDIYETYRGCCAFYKNMRK